MYTVRITRTAEKQLKKLPPPYQSRVAAVIASFEIEPRPTGCKKLSGEQDAYRVRVGDYRIVYDISDNEVTVLVLKIGHRKEIYR